MLTNKHEPWQLCRRRGHSSHHCTYGLNLTPRSKIGVAIAVRYFLAKVAPLFALSLRRIKSGFFCFFLFLLLPLLATAFTHDDIHCPTTEEWHQEQTSCLCRSAWKPSSKLLNKIISAHADWLQHNRNERRHISGQAVLCNASIMNADFRGVNLEESIFTGTQLMNPDFNDARLDFADFSGANLMNASFDNSRMQTTNFQNSNLLNTSFNGTYMPYVDFPGCISDKRNLQCY